MRNHQALRSALIGTCCILSIFVLLALPACSKMNVSKPKRSWYAKFNWRAEDYFDDPQVIALCQAIEAEDLSEIDRLVAAGADVNAQGKGKGKMTPLLWAFPENKPEVFKRILEHGADPNVFVESDFGTNMSGIVPGDSVTHLAAETWFPNYFKYVMQHGGDPNLVEPQHHETPLFSVIKGRCANKPEAVQILIDAGADLDFVSGGGVTPAMQAVTWFGQYGIALQLLQAGADPEVYQTKSNAQLVHMVVGEQRRKAYWSPQQKTDYGKLEQWLTANGASIANAKQDNARWTKMGKYPPAMARRYLEKEIEERLRREEAEKAKQKSSDNDKEKGKDDAAAARLSGEQARGLQASKHPSLLPTSLTAPHGRTHLSDRWGGLGVDSGRVAPGDCSPGAPTDPDVQVSRIRFLK